ncbi:MAG: Holliday junction branch migration protein RuvA, partial [Oscillospiraceae bacterium]|nr:Holliday junction branch migration protein RuvA [Oscillospiraceae bacterium]
MFYYFNGEITLLESGLAVVDCGGVGYACRTTAYTISKLRVGQKAKLFAFCNIRQDAFDLFGFSSREELSYFEQLIGVTGVGPKAALAILSATTPERFALAIMSQDERALTMAQGVG